MRRKARVDANHAEITEALRRCGWTVLDTSRLGSGFPDLLAAKHGRIELIEVKDGRKVLSQQKPTPAEQKVADVLAGAGVTVRYVNCMAHVLALSQEGAIR